MTTPTARRLPSLMVLAALLLITSACGGGTSDGTTSGAGTTAGSVTVEDVRSRVALAANGFGAVYMDITNTGDEDNALVGASVDPSVAGIVELHETVPADEGTEGMDEAESDAMAEGMTEGESEGVGNGEMDGMGGMQMVEVTSMPIPAGETTTLEPGGLHVMLIELATDLEDGDEFEVDLVFEDGTELTVTSTVSSDV